MIPAHSRPVYLSTYENNRGKGNSEVVYTALPGLLSFVHGVFICLCISSDSISLGAHSSVGRHHCAEESKIQGGEPNTPAAFRSGTRRGANELPIKGWKRSPKVSAEATC